MKKLITLLIVLICCVGTVGAQRVGTNSKIYIKNSVGWSKMYMYIYGASSGNNEWPGVEMTETETINGVTYFVKEFDPNSGAKIVLTNGLGSGTGNQTTDWTNTSLDLFLDVLESTESDGKHSINRLEAWYLYNTDDDTYSLVNTSIGQDNFTVELDNLASPRNFNFIIASTGAFNWKTTLDNNYLVYRPLNAQDETLSFQVKSPSYTWNNQSSGHFSLVATNPAVYVFTLASDKRYSYTAYFTRTPSATSTGYMTYSYGFNAALPDGVTAYFATGIADGNVTLTSKTGSLKANAGYMLKGTAGTEYKFYATNVAPTVTDEDVSANLMKPSVSATNVAASTNGRYHYFFSSQPSVAFYRLEADATSAAGRAYLETTSTIGSSASGAKLNLIIGDDETTAIYNVKATTVDSNAPIYNIAGQRVANDYKGIVIQNGRKYVVK